MGKVLNGFDNGYPGAISRGVDDIVIPMGTMAFNGIAFGLPVAYDSTKTGVTPFAATHTAEDFVGIAVRSASKTPSAYGSSQGQYNSQEMVDVLVRGSTVVQCVTGTPAPGGAVYILKANGRFSAEAATGGTDNVLIPNMKFRGTKDSYGYAEAVILERMA